MKHGFDHHRRKFLQAAGYAFVPAGLASCAGGGSTLPAASPGPGRLYPSYNSHPIAPDASGMTSTAQALAARIRLGWMA
ncbi:hypothetical protein [Hydrocarboniphaga sp.]|uniref:hypothetical protein n=1 Tax=Hydrocarboniphaga sp. TaxID=2033016 RepID=UPI003D115336